VDAAKGNVKRRRKLTPSEVAVLGLLGERPRSGYEISAVVEERGMREWTDLASSSVYAILKRLATLGLVHGRVEVVNGRARSRNALTPAGRRQLKESVRRLLEAVGRPKSELDVGIANVACLPVAEVKRILAKRQAALQEQIDRLEAVKSQRSRELPYFVRALFDRPLAQMRAEQSWLTKLIAEVESP
jgi:DNA-binding PadR family transcriptional regulator